MAYGRLDVFWPDGKFRSFPLAKKAESVGRSPGNTISLETDTISRYHLSITHEAGEVRLADLESQNGTYIDGVKLPDGETYLLQGGEEISIGHLRMIYHEMDEMPTQPIRPDGDITQKIVAPEAPFELSVQPPPIAIPPGAHASIDLTITNTSSEKGFYIVDVEGVPRAWVRVDRPRLMLDPEESGQVVLNIKPARRSDTAPGEYPVTIAIREENHPQSGGQVTTHLQILPYSGFGVALERHNMRQGERFRLHVHNQGSAPLPLALSTSEKTPDVQIQWLSAPQVTLAPGQRLVLQGVLRPTKNKLLGQAEIRPFDIVLRSQDPSQFMAVVRGKMQQQPLMPAWVPAAAGAALIAAVVLAVVLFRALTAPVPNVALMEVAATRVPRGETVDITYAVTDVAELSLLVDETPIAELDPNANSTRLGTNNLPDNAVISLLGVNRNRESRLDQFIQVFDPIEIVSFSAEPPQLVRNVVQELTLSWVLENAAYVQIGGLDAFTTTVIDSSVRYDAQDTLEGVVGIPSDTLTIELYAEDELGNPFVQQYTIDVISPQCTPQDEAVPVRDGPNFLNRQVGTVPADATVVVDARDVTGAWVRVQLGGDLTGWGALDAFTCANTFNPAELRQEIDVIPPPIPTETPTLPPLPTETPTSQGTVQPEGAIVGTPPSSVPDTPPPTPTTAG